MLNLILFFAAIGVICSFFLVVMALKSNPKEAEPQQFIDVNDLPNWQPMTPIQKRSNRVLNKMYKGRAENENL